MWKLATERAKAISAAWLAGLHKQSQAAQEISHRINQDYLANLEWAAMNPEDACSVDARALTAEEAQSLTSIQEGIDLCFICRMSGCMFFGRN